MIISKLINFLNYKKSFPYFIVTPCPYAIGTASADLMYTGYFSIKNKKKLIVIFPSFFFKTLNYNICNYSLFNEVKFFNQLSCIEKLIKIFISFFINLEFYLVRSYVVLINDKFFKKKLPEKIRFLSTGRELGLRKKTFDEIESLFKHYDGFDINRKIFYFLNKVEKKCFDIFSRLDISKSKKKKFICIHAREASFRKDLGRREYRNINIDNFTSSINYLIDQGYSVIRLGDQSMKRLNIKNKNFLDYPFSEIKSESMDIFFIKNCFFYIGTSSGILDTARLFNKPTLISNMINPLSDSYPLRYFDRGYLKNVYDKKKLKINEFLSYPFKFHNPERDVTELKFEENTSEDNFLNIQEYLKVMETSNFSFSNIQEKYLNLKKKYIVSFLSKEINNYTDPESLVNFHEAKKIIFYLYLAEGCLTNNYLENNFY